MASAVAPQRDLEFALTASAFGLMASRAQIALIHANQGRSLDPVDLDGVSSLNDVFRQTIRVAKAYASSNNRYWAQLRQTDRRFAEPIMEFYLRHQNVGSGDLPRQVGPIADQLTQLQRFGRIDRNVAEAIISLIERLINFFNGWGYS